MITEHGLAEQIHWHAYERRLSRIYAADLDHELNAAEIERF